MRLEPVGYISGRRNHETYGVSNLEFKEGMGFKDQLERNLGIDAKFQRMEDDPNMVELLFDTNEESQELIEKNLLPQYPNANFEKIDVLPKWVKSFLMRIGGGYRAESRYGNDRYGRSNQRDFRSSGGFMDNRGGERRSGYGSDR